MPPVPPRSAGGQATTGIVWSNYGPASPVGCGMPKTRSGAYGIPQSLPADKMAAFGANYRDDAAVQIDWGLWYIAQTYGSPSKAWQHSEQIGWY